MTGLKDLEDRVTALENKIQDHETEIDKLRLWIKEAMKWKRILDPLPPEPGDL